MLACLDWGPSFIYKDDTEFRTRILGIAGEEYLRSTTLIHEKQLIGLRLLIAKSLPLILPQRCSSGCSFRCVVAFEGQKQEASRKRNDINSRSNGNILAAEADFIWAKIDKKVIVKIGTNEDLRNLLLADYQLIYPGEDFAVQELDYELSEACTHFRVVEENVILGD
ncbi:hypothetical protein F8388_011396 [Cannabis sativa]|uniref:alpha-amylase n=1 Tax=Cannabis sativa TaxID=3483 RepID=A0A7J6EY15_CANSA|nr:hypothetical protein F8388_011396 [Cannabis sativa]KAF4404273.1 hypothetical protein G4B88_014729 [Cannabis sativa]